MPLWKITVSISTMPLVPTLCLSQPSCYSSPGSSPSPIEATVPAHALVKWQRQQLWPWLPALVKRQQQQQLKLWAQLVGTGSSPSPRQLSLWRDWIQPTAAQGISSMLEPWQQKRNPQGHAFFIYSSRNTGKAWVISSGPQQLKGCQTLL